MPRVIGHFRGLLRRPTSYFASHFHSLSTAQNTCGIMPFATDTSWPQGLLDIFNVSRNENAPVESRYYGPYDRLFNYALIEGSFTLFLAPQSALDEVAAREAVDFVVFLVVFNQEKKPVLFAEIKDDKWANNPSRRLEADTQMRHRFDLMIHNSAVPHLYGLSLLGTSLRVYRGDKATGAVTPAFVGRPHADRLLPPDFLEGQWNLDILSLDGLKKMQEIVAYIKTALANVVGQ